MEVVNSMPDLHLFSFTTPEMVQGNKYAIR